jgi:YVTN family beta-propeller protein
VDIIDVAALKVIDHLDVGPDPEVFDLSPDGKTMYVGNEDDAELSFFDMATRKKVGTVKVGAEPEGVLAHPNGKIPKA